MIDEAWRISRTGAEVDDAVLRRIGSALAANRLTVNPFVSESQRRWMHANHPQMAERWEAHTPKGKKLPKRKGRSVQNLRAFARRKRLPTYNASTFSPHRSDPSRTAATRKAFFGQLRMRLMRLKGDVLRLLVQEDALGTRADRVAVHNAAQWRFLDEPGKASSFAEWLAARLEAELFDEKSKRLWHAYARTAFDKGAKRSLTEAGARLGPRFSFVQMLLSRKDVADKVRVLGQRNVSDLAGIAEHLKAGMQRAMLDGIARKDGPAKIAKALNKVVDDGIRRAKALATSNTVRAHADGQLWGFSQAGARNVKVLVEWVTAGDDKVCPTCEMLEGVVLPVDKAHGLIPRHVGCRCAFALAEPGKRRFLADEDRDELQELFEDMF